MKSKLLSYMFVCLLLMVAFSMAFWIILDGHIEKNGKNFSTGFWIDLVYMVTMSTGEFNTGDFYGDIQKASKEVKVFAMIFLIGMVILSTITMVNLLVAAIINDYEKMMEEVGMENLYFITEYIIEQGEFERSSFCEALRQALQPLKMGDGERNLWYGKTWTIQMLLCQYLFPTELEKSEKIIEFCPHLICSQRTCQMDPLPIPRPGCWRYSPEMEANERKPLLFKLLEIRKGYNWLLEEKEESQNECDYHKFGLDFSDETNTTRVRA